MSVPECKSLLLDYYHCTFFLPLIGIGPEYRPKEEPVLYHEGGKYSEEDAQAWLYFSPTLRDILFQQQIITDKTKHPRPIEEWRLTKEVVEGLRLHLGKDKHKNNPLLYQVAAFHSVRLYRYFNGIYVLAFTLMPEVLTELLKKQHQKISDNKNALIVAKQKKDKNWRLTGEESEELDEQAIKRAEEKDGVPLFFRHAPATAEEALESYGEAAVGYEKLQLEAWLRFTRLARQIYPTYAEQREERKIAPLRLFENSNEIECDFNNILALKIQTKDGVLISNILRNLLNRFFEKPLDFELKQKVQFDDDRMHVSVAYSLAKKDLPPEQLKRIFSLALYVDRFEDAWQNAGMNGYAYTPSWVEARMEKQCLGIWEGLGGYYGYTEYSAAALYPNGFFRDVIAPRHILPIYDRMLLQALFYKASLRMYDEQICKETGKMINGVEWNRVRKYRAAFIRFTNQYWFHDLTEQMQGKEIFRLQQQALGLKEHYEIIKDELERTDEFLLSEHERRLAIGSLVLAVGGVIIALVSLMPVINDAWVDSQDQTLSIWYWIGSKLGFSGVGAGLSGVLVTMAPLAFLGYKIWKKLKQPQPPETPPPASPGH